MRTDDRQMRIKVARNWAGKEQSEAAHGARHGIIDIVEGVTPSLFDVTDMDDPFLEGKREIDNRIRVRFDPKQDVIAYEKNLRVLAELIEFGNHQSWWRITIPGYPVDVEHETHHLDRLSLRRMAYIDDVRSALQKFSLQRKSSAADSRMAARCALLSAVVFAAQGTAEKLRAVAAATLKNIEIRPAAATLVTRLVMSLAAGTAAAEQNDGHDFSMGSKYRVFLDPLTFDLMRSLAADGADSIAGLLQWTGPVTAKQLWKDLCVALAFLGLDVRNIETLGAFLEYAKAWFALNTNGLLATIATNNHYSPSLSPDAMRRVMTGETATGEMLARAGRRNHPRPDLAPRALDLVTDIKACFYRAQKQRRASTELLAELEHIGKSHRLEAGSIGTLLLSFLVNRITVPRARKPPRPSSMLRYVDTLGFSILGAFTDVSPLDLSPADRGQRYLAMLDDREGKGRKAMAKLIVSFEKHLDTVYDTSPVGEAHLIRLGQESLHGLGNLITPHEYRRIRSTLGYERWHGLVRNDRIRVLGFILAFRLGFRIGEIQRIRFRDLRLDAEPVIWVVSSELGSTKTQAAHRRLRLDLYLDDEELALLAKWYGIRQREGAGPDNPLFSKQGHSEKVVNDDLLRLPVQEAMRSVTGDGALTFRHLRHSFATWTLLRLLSAHFSQVAREHMHVLQCPEFDESACQNLRNALSPESLDRKAGLNAVRTATYLVCAQLGHLTPWTTLENYVHLLDWVLIMACNAHQEFDARDVMAITGWSQAQVYRVKTEHDNANRVIDGNALMAIIAKRGGSRHR